MMTKKDFLAKYPNIREGLKAQTTDGEKLGEVVAFNDDHLVIEKGFFFPKDFSIRYGDVKEVLGRDTLVVGRGRSEFESWRDEKYEGWDKVERAGRGEKVDIPLREERIEARKVERPAGEVRVRKIVHSEVKTIQVPVRKEEVVIERKPVEGREAKPEEGAFKEEEIRIPLSEEEIEVRKRPVVKEEVRIRKDEHIEEKKVSEEVRSEDVDVKRTDKDKGKAA